MREAVKIDLAEVRPEVLRAPAELVDKANRRGIVVGNFFVCARGEEIQ